MHPGQLIRKLRRERNWTQEDLAKRLYVTRQTVSAWEKGLAQPSSQSLLAAAKVFEISLSQLMGDGAADEPASTAPVTEQSAVTARDGALPVSFAWWPVAVLAALVCLCANSYLLLRQRPGLIVLVIVLFLTANLLPGWFERAIPTSRLRVCFHGTRVLQIFALSTAGSVAAQAILGALLLPGQWELWLWSAGFAVVVNALTFWNGMLSIWLTSVQLGLHLRLMGLLFGWIPVFHLWILKQMIRVTEHEVRFETGKHLLNLERQDEALCRTKYPILLVHGFFFRDSRIFNYWGRIPRELERNGANIYYGQQQSADSIENSAEELKTRIRAIVKDTGCEKLNVIAHSKGGLDMRQALLDPEIRAMTASLTTINTPHRGCAYADYLLEKIPEPNQRGIEKAYNAAARRLGDRDPDFMAAVRDLTKARCEEFDRQTPLPVGVFCQSVGSRLSRAGAARFPQNATYHLALHFDGPNDGLVSEGSFRWGSRLLYLTTPGREGISHGDVVDLNRRDIPEFDVREFYVRLVHDLKARGL